MARSKAPASLVRRRRKIRSAFETGGGNVSIALNLPVASFGFTSNLHAKLRLLDANGTVLADDAVVVGGGQVFENLYLAAGTFYVQVTSFGDYGDVGQYTVIVREDAGARVVNTEFMNLSDSMFGLLVTFNEPINPLTFTTMDVRVGGSAAGVGVLDVVPYGDSRRFLITLAPTTSTNFSIGPDIGDQFGNLMDQNQDGLKGEQNDYSLAVYLMGHPEGGFGYYAEEGFGYFDDELSTFDLLPKSTRLSGKYVDLAFDEY